MARLYQPHSRGLAATFADFDNQAAGQGAAPIATPGSLLERTNGGGFRYYALQRYGFDGRRSEAYLAGPVGSPEADRLAEEARAGIAEAREAMAGIRLLLREGYIPMPPSPFAVVATLANAGYYSGGGMLVGSHAFDAIVNRLGIRVEAFGTEDLDIARPVPLVMRGQATGLLEILRSVGIDMTEVPAHDHGQRTGKYVARGRSKFTVDLLVPTRSSEPAIVHVPELKAHAIALPFLAYLLAESQPATVLSRFGCVAVRVPVPERFTMHKMLVSRLRSGRSQKSSKDLRQAASLAAALAEMFPGALTQAFASLPKSAVARVRSTFPQVVPMLDEHPAAAAELTAL